MDSRWLALGVGSLAQLTTATAFFPGLAAIAPALAAIYRIDLVQVGTLFSALQAGPSLVLAVWGRVTDRWGDRTALALGLLGAGAALMLAARTREYAGLLVALTLGSMFGSSTAIASARLAAERFSASQRALAMGIRQMSVPLGGALAAIALPILAIRLGTAQLFETLAVLCGVVAAVTWYAAAPAPVRLITGGHLSVHGPLSDRRLWRLASGSGLLILAQNSLTAYFVVFLTLRRGLPLQAAALVFLGAQLGGAAMRVVVGAASDRLGTRVQPMRWLALLIALGLAATSALLDSSLPLVSAILLVTTVAAMCPTALAYTTTAEIVGPEKVGAALGFQLTVLSVAGISAPVGFGLLATYLGWRAAFGVIAGVAVAAFVVLQPLAIEERGRWTTAEAKAG